MCSIVSVKSSEKSTGLIRIIFIITVSIIEKIFLPSHSSIQLFIIFISMYLNPRLGTTPPIVIGYFTLIGRTLDADMDIVDNLEDAKIFPQPTFRSKMH